MAPPMKRGANVSLTREVPGLTGVVLGVDWDAGNEWRLSEGLVFAALLCGPDGKVVSDEHVVFFNQLTSPELSVAQLDKAMGNDDEQIEVHLAQVPPAVTRIVVVLYVNDGPGARRTLGQLLSLTVRVLDLRDNRELVRSEQLATALDSETAITLGELYHHLDGWRFKVVGQGYSTGMTGIARDYGIAT
jgi:tellurium resistance protein TerD